MRCSDPCWLSSFVVSGSSEGRLQHRLDPMFPNVLDLEDFSSPEACFVTSDLGLCDPLVTLMMQLRRLHGGGIIHHKQSSQRDGGLGVGHH